MTTYASPDMVPERCDCLTAEKEYAVHTSGIYWFTFIDDQGELRFSNWQNSRLLDGGNWRRIEK